MGQRHGTIHIQLLLAHLLLERLSLFHFQLDQHSQCVLCMLNLCLYDLSGDLALVGRKVRIRLHVYACVPSYMHKT